MQARLAVVALVLLVLAGLWWAAGDDAAAPRVRSDAAEALAPPRRDAPRARERERAASSREAAPGAAATDTPTPGGDAPERAVPKARHRILVTVTDSGGGRAQGASVRVVDAFAHHFGFRRPGDLATGRTDAEGRAELSAPKDAALLVLAERDGEAAVGERLPAPPENPFDDEETDVVLRLVPAFVVRGRVVDAAGNGLERALVTLQIATGRDPIGVGLSRVCGEAGEFRFPAIPRELPNSPFVDLEARRRGYVPGRLRVLRDEPYPDGVRIELAEGVSVRGRCVDERGEPVARVHVSAPEDNRLLGLTAEDGTFDLPGIAGSACVLIPASHAPVRLEGLAARGPDVDVGDVVLREGASIRGVVVDVEGKPVRAAVIRAGADAFGGAYRHAGSRADGRFEVRLLATGAHFVTVQARVPFPGGELLEARLENVDPGGAEVRVVLSGARTLLVRFLRESDREPFEVDDVKLTATPTDGAGEPLGWAWAGSGLRQVRVEFEKAGLYDLQVEIPGYTTGELRGVEVDAQRSAEVDVLFRKTAD